MKKLILTSYLLGIWACQSSDSKVDETKIENPITTEVNSVQEVSNSTIDTIVIEGMQFKPAEINMHPGDTLVWVNKDIVMHNVTDDPGQNWTSGDIEVGKTWMMIPATDMDYYCTIHPTMKGKIKLVPRQ